MAFMIAIRNTERKILKNRDPEILKQVQDGKSFGFTSSGWQIQRICQFGMINPEDLSIRNDGIGVLLFQNLLFQAPNIHKNTKSKDLTPKIFINPFLLNQSFL